MNPLVELTVETDEGPVTLKVNPLVSEVLRELFSSEGYEVRAVTWDPADHPRWEAGTEKGGEFKAKGDLGALGPAPLEIDPAAQDFYRQPTDGGLPVSDRPGESNPTYNFDHRAKFKEEVAVALAQDPAIRDFPVDQLMQIDFIAAKYADYRDQMDTLMRVDPQWVNARGGIASFEEWWKGYREDKPSWSGAAISIGSLIESWAISATGRDVAAEIQAAVYEEFGLFGTAQGWERVRQNEWFGGQDPNAPTEFNPQADAAFRGFLRKMVRAMYNHTQDRLAAAGIESVALHRGITDDEQPRGNQVRHRSYPLSSWTASTWEAKSFAIRTSLAPYSGSHILSARVPRSRILATPHTGFGALPEWEYVVIGGDDVVTVSSALDLKMDAAESLAEINENIYSADWVKSICWDLPIDPTAFMLMLDNQGMTLGEFRLMPAWQAAPPSVRALVADPDAPTRHYGPGPHKSGSDQDVHGKPGGGDEEVSEETTARLEAAAKDIAKWVGKYKGGKPPGHLEVEVDDAKRLELQQRYAVQHAQMFGDLKPPMTAETMERMQGMTFTGYAINDFYSHPFCTVALLEDGWIAGAQGWNVYDQTREGSEDADVTDKYAGWGYVGSTPQQIGSTGITKGAGTALWASFVKWSAQRGYGIHVTAARTAVGFWRKMGLTVPEGGGNATLTPAEVKVFDRLLDEQKVPRRSPKVTRTAVSEPDEYDPDDDINRDLYLAAKEAEGG